MTSVRGPLEAVERWLPDHPEFEADAERERMLFTFSPSGFLKRREEDATLSAL